MKKYQQIPTAVNCPVCNTKETHILWSVNSIQAAQEFVLREKFPERNADLATQIEVLWKQNSCEFVRCDKCGFCHSNPYIAGDSRFYTLAYDRSGYPAWKWEFQKTYDVLKSYSGSNTKLIEIGAGNGAFIKRVSENIISKENILCTEFSEYGIKQIEELGVKCYSKDIRDISDAELVETIDVICMFQVLEHMDRLDVLFQKLNKLMKVGGSLFIAVPNAKRIEFNELNGALLEMPPNHIGRWNKVCFEEIGNLYGFHVEDYAIEEFDLKSMALQFIYYRFLNKSHKSGSFENRLRAVKNKNLYKIANLIGMGVNAVTAIPALMKTGFRQGGSQWVQLKKIADK